MTHHPCLTNPLSLPLRPSCSALEFGPTLVIAPHQDDESLGCGGLIALLRHAAIPVAVVFVSDGSGSHPGSRRYPAPALTALRNAEAREALAILGVDARDTHLLGLPDRYVPRCGTPEFAHAVKRCHDIIAAITPETVLLPWRRDPHTDHRASWEIATHALRHVSPRPRTIEYPIWAWDTDDPGDLPQPGEMTAWRLDISEVVEQKRRAVAAHRSQTTQMIDDDPVGWYLTPETLARFHQPWEVFLEPVR